jgi:hypothetical protein
MSGLPEAEGVLATPAMEPADRRTRRHLHEGRRGKWEVLFFTIGIRTVNTANLGAVLAVGYDRLAQGAVDQGG